MRAIRRTLTIENLSGEVIVVDNGSMDGSAQIAGEAGAHVVREERPGYGIALRAGFAVARGEYFVMADADGSYDFGQIPQLVNAMRQGNELVVGNRFTGAIRAGAMPWQNRYIGNPVLSGLGRLFFHTNIRDFHCGLRGLRAAAYRKLNLECDGMEFASEMVIKASLQRMRTAEIPTSLGPRAEGSSSQLRPWRDGWRHVGLILSLYAYRRRVKVARSSSRSKRSGQIVNSAHLG